MPRRAVFLDRDGTLIEEAGYLNDLDRLHFFPYSVDAVRQLNRAGLVVVVTTNQAGIARGIIPESFVASAHQHISDRMAQGGARIDGFYYCPHHVDGIVPELRIACACRKPQAGLWMKAAAEMDLDLATSFTVGDRWLDVRAGRTAGTRTVLVRTGYGSVEAGAPPAGITADAVVTNLAAAVGWILAQP